MSVTIANCWAHLKHCRVLVITGQRGYKPRVRFTGVGYFRFPAMRTTLRPMKVQ